jgi:hypothetical protein
MLLVIARILLALKDRIGGISVAGKNGHLAP